MFRMKMIDDTCQIQEKCLKSSTGGSGDGSIIPSTTKIQFTFHNGKCHRSIKPWNTRKNWKEIYHFSLMISIVQRITWSSIWKESGMLNSSQFPSTWVLSLLLQTKQLGIWFEELWKIRWNMFSLWVIFSMLSMTKSFMLAKKLFPSMILSTYQIIPAIRVLFSELRTKNWRSFWLLISIPVLLSKCSNWFVFNFQQKQRNYTSNILATLKRERWMVKGRKEWWG